MPSIAEQILRDHAGTSRVNKVAQTRCVSMTRDHRKDKDRYRFADRSGITVARVATYIS